MLGFPQAVRKKLTNPASTSIFSKKLSNKTKFKISIKKYSFITTTLSSYESSKMTVLQTGHMPLYSIKHFWINRRTAGKVNPEVFFIAHLFQHQEGIGQR